MLLSPQIDVVVPVCNEEVVLERSIRRLHRFLSSEFPFTWRIVVADNASTDSTPAIAARLARELTGVAVIRLDRKGRGRALRTAWSASEARVVCYMDVDLSTDLRGVLPLVAPLLSGHSDLRSGRAWRTARAWYAAPSASSSRAPTTARRRRALHGRAARGGLPSARRRYDQASEAHERRCERGVPDRGGEA
jgi:hypothetical protein